MNNYQIYKTENWLKTCPSEYAISSMQGGFIHIKISVPMDREIETVKEDSDVLQKI